MPIIYDKLYDKLKYIPTKALYNGGYYLDVFNGTPGYLTEASADKNIYLDPVTGKLEYRATIWTPVETTTWTWLDGADTSTIVESGGSVSQWDDKSGNAFDVSQSDNLRKPVTGLNPINGLNALTFNGSTTWLERNNVDFASLVLGTDKPYYFFYVCKPDNTTQNSRVVSIGGVNVDESVHSGPTFDAPTSRKWRPCVFFDSGSPRYVDSNYTPSTDVVMVGAGYDGSNLPTGRINGSDANDLQVGSTPVGNNWTTPCCLRIGESTFPINFPFSGEIAEVIILPDYSSTEVKERIEGYLAWKWGVLITDPAHPYFSKPPLIL